MADPAIRHRHRHRRNRWPTAKKRIWPPTDADGRRCGRGAAADRRACPVRRDARSVAAPPRERER